MSCGLGAIILVLMLVRHNTQDAPKEASAEVELLAAELARLEAAEEGLGARIADLLRETAAAGSEAEEREAALARLRDELARSRAEIADRGKSIRALEQSIEAAGREEQEAPPDPVAVEGRGEETYLIGLRVEGRRIGILLDASASMTDEALIDVIRRKNMPEKARRDGPKWKRAVRVTQWLLARLPQGAGAEVAVVAYGEAAKRLGDAAGTKASDAGALARILADLDRIAPGGATNLDAGLAEIAGHRPTDLYVVTDGLPTAGGSKYRGLNPFSACGGLWGSSATISGECRVRLFRHTVSGAGIGARVNVILLPIEGDPEASREYWRWTAATGGLLISPAASWP